MEYGEYCESRWIMFLAGLFWCPVIPIAYILMFNQLMLQSIITIIFVSIVMAILTLTAILILINGISGLIANGKKHLILNDENLLIIINSGKQKGKVYDINYDQIKEFYFVSNGTRKDKLSGKFYIKENAGGTINFNIADKFYCVSIYNAMSAARFIIDKLQDEQIAAGRNELDRDGNHTPKD